MRVIPLLAVFLAAAPVASEPTPPRLARLTVTADLTSVFLINSLGVSVSARLTKGLAISLSGGAGFALRLGPVVGFAGSQALVHGLIGAERHFFEVAGGAAFVFSEEYAPFMRPFVISGPFAVMPAGFLGYRFQRDEGGVVLRLGLALSYGFNPGFAASVGFAI